MSLRDEFEKSYLGANPHLARHNSTDDSYVLPSIQDAWVGFQAGHAAGLERAAEEADNYESSFGSMGSSSAARALRSLAAAIRAMKEQKK